MRELSRAVTAFLPTPTLPLPEDLRQVIETYLQKHEKYDDGASTRLHDETLSIYNKHVKGFSDRLTPFMAVLTPLLPVLRTPERIFVWWDLISKPLLTTHSQDKDVLPIGLSGVVYLITTFEPEPDTTNPFVDRLLSLWLEKYDLFHFSDDRVADSRERGIRDTLMAFSKKKPKVRRARVVRT